MKYVWMSLRLALFAASVVLAALSMKESEATRTTLLGGAMLCLSLGTLLNLYFQRKEKQSKQ